MLKKVLAAVAAAVMALGALAACASLDGTSGFKWTEHSFSAENAVVSLPDYYAQLDEDESESVFYGDRKRETFFELIAFPRYNEEYLYLNGLTLKEIAAKIVPVLEIDKTTKTTPIYDEPFGEQPLELKDGWNNYSCSFKMVTPGVETARGVCTIVESRSHFYALFSYTNDKAFAKRRDAIYKDLMKSFKELEVAPETVEISASGITGTFDYGWQPNELGATSDYVFSATHAYYSEWVEVIRDTESTAADIPAYIAEQYTNAVVGENVFRKEDAKGREYYTFLIEDTDDYGDDFAIVSRVYQGATCFYVLEMTYYKGDASSADPTAKLEGFAETVADSFVFAA